MDSLLDIIQQIDTDVEITNEHVANFESLLEGIENGSVDLNNAIKSGTLKLTTKKAASTDSTRNSGLKSGSGKVREVRFVNTFKVTDAIVDFLYAQLYMPSGFSRDQAQKDLQDLCDAGLIDWNGNFIALNVYENGQKANLDKLIERIEKGQMVGSLKVNGHAVTSMQIVKIQLVARLMKAVAKHEISTPREREEIQELITLLRSGKINLSWFAENMASFLIDKSSIGKGNVTDALSDALLQTFRGGFPSLSDESNAKKYLQALYEALIIDANGNFIEAYVKEADSYVSLEDVAQRIRNGDTVGKLAINGNAATPEQVAALRKMKKVMAFTQRYMQSGGSFHPIRIR